MARTKRLSVIIPVGPGHQEHYPDAVKSLRLAQKGLSGLEVEVITVDDTQGLLGRSAARNQGLRQATGDWIAWLDADDVVYPGALSGFIAARLVYPESLGIWGELWIESSRRKTFGAGPHRRLGPIVSIREQRSDNESGRLWQWDHLVRWGPFGALHVGCFIEAEAARALPWVEAWDIGEDVEWCWAFACHFPFVKIERRLVKVRIWIESAGGPRGYGRLTPPVKNRWIVRAEKIAGWWKKRGQVPLTEEEKKLRLEGTLYGDVT